VLPASEIDQLLLSFCKHEYWQKVARIISKAYEVIEQREGQLPKGIADEMDARLAILVASGQLESKGNIKRWTRSEVRFPGTETVEVEASPFLTGGC
jgi:uncharacterized protein DUF3658